VSPVRPTVRIVGERLDPEHHRLRDFLTRIAQPHEWLEAGSPEAARALSDLGLADPPLPVVIDGGEVYTGATVERLVEAWHYLDPPKRSSYDLAIIGAGPAGLGAAVYAASDGLSTIVLERDVPGGQASHTSLIENFFGFPDGIGGAELARLAGRQAEQFGAEVMVFRGALGSTLNSEPVTLHLEGGIDITSSVVLAATGMDWRRLELDGVDELLDRGVYYGAGRSEATQCGGDDVAVVGAGNSAGQPHTLIHVRLGTHVTALHERDGHLSAVSFADEDGKEETRPTRALFICIGGVPHTGWCPAEGVVTDPAGYILTGPDLLDAGRRPDGWPLDRDPLPLETSRAGLFAAGDVRHGSTKRVAGAVGEGAMAVVLAFRRLAELGLAA
jgi:thioredoxin reductase (NADPH)